MSNNLFVKTNGEFVLGEDDIVTKYDVMQDLGISQSTLQRLMRKGLPFTMFENRAGFVMSEVNEWLNNNGHEHIRIAARLRKSTKAKVKTGGT